MVRPFFLDPVTQEPLSTKVYYDIASWIATQTTFSFVVAPFVILGFSDSIAVWCRLYFYAVITTGGSLAFFMSPGKKWLRSVLEQRSKAAGVAKIPRSLSTDSLASANGNGNGHTKAPVLGLSQDLERDVNEMLDEAKIEFEKARKADPLRLHSNGHANGNGNGNGHLDKSKTL
jgi:lysophospholipid acyltransferase